MGLGIKRLDIGPIFIIFLLASHTQTYAIPRYSISLDYFRLFTSSIRVETKLLTKKKLKNLEDFGINPTNRES